MKGYFILFRVADVYLVIESKNNVNDIRQISLLEITVSTTSAI
jgi:hypothetical protein